ncbi:hypothetical protein BCR37DRAFT_103654 [Protomyces lactucae-debilis]|uniref:Indole-diterpene biosynthesis protein PaxU n=1 Tax=Protomyces lactucae-debilis TaxID=2754530 RepID=A0A1Y2F579_PROLT|nr:uncharacterized protein BCR37DRAFT_103654 [Protomyces lactucae-debilis]ORY79078.1 hypothetical protein BCR37DRAFT_103654 [Protomyces lactucae-debilis]
MAGTQTIMEPPKAPSPQPDTDIELKALSKRFHFTPPSILKPRKAVAHGRQPQPRLILIFGWLGARLKHVKKYAAGYHVLYPSSPIIVVRSFPTDMRPFSKFGREFHILTSLLAQYSVDITKPGNGVLMQAFSNGGCWSVSALINRLDEFTVLRPQTMIFDSCPGRARYMLFIKAFVAANNLGILSKIFAVFWITLGYWTFKLFCRLRGQDPFGERRHEMLHHVHAQRRCYVYSKQDDLIDYRDVLSHARQVQEYHLGSEQVTTEEFDGSAHVDHLRLDEARYWRIVQKLWDPALQPTEVKVPPLILATSKPSVMYGEEREVNSLVAGIEGRRDSDVKSDYGSYDASSMKLAIEETVFEEE